MTIAAVATSATRLSTAAAIVARAGDGVFPQLPVEVRLERDRGAR